MHNEGLLDAVYQATEHAHQHARRMTEALRMNGQLAGGVVARKQALHQLRQRCDQQLKSTRELEVRWRDKEQEMYSALRPFSSPRLLSRLQQATGEQEAVSEALLKSFLAEPAGRDVADFIREYQEARTLYHLRRERSERWQEGRVGGWR